MNNVESTLESAIYEAYWEKVMNGEEVSPDDLERALSGFTQGQTDESADSISGNDIWESFEQLESDTRNREACNNDDEIWQPSYHTGESAASAFERIDYANKTYEKQLRYTSLHEVTNYKSLIRKDVLRGSANFDYDETSGKFIEKPKREKPKATPKDDDNKELNPAWVEWSQKFGSMVHGLREDMLGSRTVIDAFDTDHKHISELWTQGNLFSDEKGRVIPPEPEQYTGRIKNPLWLTWAKCNFKRDAPRCKFHYTGDTVTNDVGVMRKPRTVQFSDVGEVDFDHWRLNNEPAFWIWPHELEAHEQLPKIKKRKEYTIPRSKVRSKSAAFFQVKQSAKFMAFYTVSFPAGIPDDLAYQLFQTWLTRLREEVGLRSYLWVAERQEGKHRHRAIETLNNKRDNGLAKAKTEAEKKKINDFYDKKINDWKPTHAVHFHLLTNNFMPIWTANRFMAASLKTQKKRGKYSFLEDFDPEKYNGVDVKFVGNNRKRLGYYLTKYITKNETAIEHAVWRCSRNISALFTEQLAEDDKQELMWRIIKDKYIKKEGDKAPLFRKNGQFVDKIWIPPWILSRVNGQLIDINQQVFDLFDKAESLYENLRNAFRHMPTWLLWREITNLTKRKKAKFRKERLEAALRETKSREIRELSTTDRRIVNKRLIRLKDLATAEGFTL